MFLNTEKQVVCDEVNDRDEQDMLGPSSNSTATVLSGDWTICVLHVVHVAVGTLTFYFISKSLLVLPMIFRNILKKCFCCYALYLLHK